MEIKKPIIVVGSPRSETTMLAETILAHHPDIAYWGEPNHIWSFGNAYRRNDVLTEDDVTPQIRSFIRQQFQAFVEEHGRARFMEKTKILNKIFPEFYPTRIVLERVPGESKKYLHTFLDWEDLLPENFF